jgi:hypothetical protein
MVVAFLATLYYLHQTRSDPFLAFVYIARKKVAPLLVRFEGIAENEWTEVERRKKRKPTGSAFWICGTFGRRKVARSNSITPPGNCGSTFVRTAEVVEQ